MSRAERGRSPRECVNSCSAEGATRTAYREKGFIHRPGVVWIGQSVLLMPPRDAAELSGRLLRLGVRVATAPVSVVRESLEAFRWGSRLTGLTC